MLQINSVEAALYSLVASNAVAVNSGFHVDLHEPLNTDPSRWPWVGIVVPRVRVDPWHAQVTSGSWLARYDLQVLVQDGSAESAERAFDRALRALDVVLNAYDADRTLQASVQHLTGWDISPYEHSLVDEDHVATYVINLTAERFA